MKMTPRVSVIIATYNRAHLLKTAVDSVLGQTFRDFEIIVADDGSTDATAELVRSYGDRVRYLYQENQGKSVMLNNALSITAGEWIAFLDSDDYWLPEKLERQFRAIEQFEEQGCGACFTDGRFVNNPSMDTTLFQFYGRKYSQATGVLPNPVETLAESSAGISVVTLLCRAELVRRAGGFDPQLRFTEDYDFVFRLALVTNYCYVNLPLAIIDRTSASVRHVGVSSMWDKVDFRLQSEQYRYEKWRALTAGSTSEIKRTILRHLRAVHSSWANWYLAREEYELAQRELSVAANYQLTPNLLVKWILARFSPKLAREIISRREGFGAEVF
jgi:glycosyltransferase involved in cell wall biosynthesis